MPPKIKIQREDIVQAGLAIVRQEGEDSLNARQLANHLHCSTQPIFSNFATMDELRLAVLTAADALYQEYLRTDMASGNYPPYKASGMAYIRFAREETALFRLLFMRDRRGEKIEEDRGSIRPLLTLLQTNLGMTEDEAYRFHLEMWIYVHGIATMIATGYLNWQEEFVSTLLTDAYFGMIQRYKERRTP